jgi:hypothetical protein
LFSGWLLCEFHDLFLSFWTIFKRQDSGCPGPPYIMCGMKSLMPTSSDIPESFSPTARRGHDHAAYFRVELEQRSKAWHDWRTNGIGGSDAPCVLDESPFKSAAELRAEKLSATIHEVDSPRIALGVALEPEARLAYRHEFGGDERPDEEPENRGAKEPVQRDQDPENPVRHR